MLTLHHTPLEKQMRRAGLEPAAPRLRGGCSCLLSLRRVREAERARIELASSELTIQCLIHSATVPKSGRACGIENPRVRG